MVASHSAEQIFFGHLPPVVTGESVLLQEINHRMLNTLTLISLGIERELSRLDGSHSGRLRKYTQRIFDYAEVYRCLCLRDRSDQIAVDAYFARLCRCLAKAILRPLGVECVLALEQGYLSSVQCERLGMIVTELVINAAKHAFGGRQGQVRIAFRRHGEDWCCSVEDNGRGFDAPKSSAGSHIVEALVASVGGSFATVSGPSGTTVTVCLPAPAPAPVISVRRYPNE